MSPREYAKQNRHIGEAWEDGKTVQYFDARDNEWIDWTKPMRPVFYESAPEWRIKPEPEQPKYRAWTKAEVPVGAVMCFNDMFDNGFVILGTNFDGDIQYVGESKLVTVSLEKAVAACKYSIDFGKTWCHCGVEVAP